MGDYYDDVIKSNNNLLVPILISILIAAMICCAIIIIIVRSNSIVDLNWKEFLLIYPEYRIFINDKQIDKYDPSLNNLTLFGHSLIRFTNIKTNENIEFAIKDHNKISFDQNLFGLIHSIKQEFYDITISIQTNDTLNKSKHKENSIMTIEQILMTILISLIVAKFGSKISWKTLFRPMKKSGQYLKKEWEDS